MSDTDRYEPLKDALEAVGAAPGASEAHGLLCGMMSGPERADRASWIALVLDGTHPRGDEAKICLAQLAQLFDATGESLEDAELGFQPLLPGDDAGIGERAEALGDWCRGYLAGLGMGGLQSRRELPKEVSEVLRDLGDIGQVEADAVDDEENEEAYAELVEYVRVGALLVMEHLGTAAGKPKSESKPAQPPRDDRTLH
ncbi:MAG: UPF0149 family protein [Ectothiorhodospiraceae bacterium]|jgi:hypothetical protein